MVVIILKRCDNVSLISCLVYEYLNNVGVTLVVMYNDETLIESNQDSNENVQRMLMSKD